MERRVVITGAGVLSTLGDSPAALHAALCEGRSSAGPVELFSTEGLACRRAHELTAFDAQAYLGKKNLRALDRTSRLVIAAASLALEQSGWDAACLDAHEVGLVLGTMFCSVRTISEFDRRGLTLGPGRVSPMDFANTVINAAAGQAARAPDAGARGDSDELRGAVGVRGCAPAARGDFRGPASRGGGGPGGASAQSGVCTCQRRSGPAADHRAEFGGRRPGHGAET